MDIIIYLLIGISVGYIGGYAGIGGGPFLVSALVLFLGLSQLESQGNMLAVMLGPMSLLGVYSLKDEVKSQLGSVVVGVFSYCFFSYFGAVFAYALGEFNMRLYFGVLLILLGLLQLRDYLAKSKIRNTRQKLGLSWVFLLSAVTGIFGGLFGIGAGVLLVPLLIILFKVQKNYARALSLAILLPPVSLGGFLKYNAEETINWSLVSAVFIGYFISNYFGAKAGTNSSTATFKICYSLLLFIIAFIYFIILI